MAERIEADKVGLNIHGEFASKEIAGGRVEVNFLLSRTAMRRFHQGVGLSVQLPASLLFPEARDVANAQAAPVVVARNINLRPFNPKLNEVQLCAVRAIVEGRVRQVPYTLGKTTTVVEAVLQCARRVHAPPAHPFHILVCAPTNVAADGLCEKLAEVLTSKADLFRVLDFSRNKGDIPHSLLKHTNWDDREGIFYKPGKDEILASTIVVATLSTAAGFHNADVPRGHFSLIVVDESGMAMEPEAVAPVAALLGGETRPRPL